MNQVAQGPIFIPTMPQPPDRRSTSSSSPRPAQPANPDVRARALGVSREAIEIVDSSEIIDLHIESFIWTRVAGYDLTRRHGRGLFGGCFYSQVDLPRMREAGMTGGVFSIATNPLRRRSRRTETLVRNVERLRSIIDGHPGCRVVATYSEWMRARENGDLGCFLAIQGGNALDSHPNDVFRIPGDVVTRITLVHLSNSPLGSTSSPVRTGEQGLTPFGRDYVRRMNERRILVDLSHSSERAFWDAVQVHDRSQPLVVTHTGVRAVHDSWRNVDDRQIRAVAKTGGVVGIIFHTGFLGERLFGGSARAIVRHMEHVIDVVGDDFVALGSDWDGFICTPSDMRTVLELPVLVQYMLDRGFQPERIRKILGNNYLRVMQQIRPGI